MEIEFDPEKDAANVAKHGVSLTAVAEIDWSRALVVEDSRRDYGEIRHIVYAEIRDRLHVGCFTMRGNVLRVIGLRKANDRERRRYGRET